ncbi:hypothetical protein M1247_29615 [Mycobacterium sp. 21AC1]|uniref:hypothetical protein n=1 Tax=[Mycobacterium] appelbergii TaxID=2939269 RepID=UPI0029394BAF|nr:hypothetical protein [Mycobacterium sp. 21AC1]MDV3129096.1 hypothetical protein [Mycobacterium sp. 21AC1]
MTIITAGDRPISIERTRRGGFRVSRSVGGNGTSLLVFDGPDVEPVAKAVLGLVEAGATSTACAATSVPLVSGPPLLIRRMRDGTLQLSRELSGGRAWMSLTDAVAVDVALALLAEVA